MFASRPLFLCFQDSTELLGEECASENDPDSFSHQNLFLPVKVLSPKLLRVGSFDYPAFLSLWLTRLSAMNCSALITDQPFELKVIGWEQTSATFLSIYTGRTQESISRPATANTRLLTNLLWFILWQIAVWQQSSLDKYEGRDEIMQLWGQFRVCPPPQQILLTGAWVTWELHWSQFPWWRMTCGGWNPCKLDICIGMNGNLRFGSIVFFKVLSISHTWDERFEQTLNPKY